MLPLDGSFVTKKISTYVILNENTSKRHLIYFLSQTLFRLSLSFENVEKRQEKHFFVTKLHNNLCTRDIVFLHS